MVIRFIKNLVSAVIKADQTNYQSHLHQILFNYNIKGLFQYIQNQPDDFHATFKSNPALYYPLCNKDFFSYWKREYSSNPELMELHNSFKGFIDSGVFKYQSLKLEVCDIISLKVKENIQNKQSKENQETLVFVKIVIFYLTSGYYNGNQELVIQFDRFVDRVIDKDQDTAFCDDFLRSSLYQLAYKFRGMSEEFDIIDDSIKYGTQDKSFYKKEQIEAKLNEFRNLPLIETLHYYRDFRAENLS